MLNLQATTSARTANASQNQFPLRRISLPQSATPPQHQWANFSRLQSDTFEVDAAPHTPLPPDFPTATPQTQTGMKRLRRDHTATDVLRACETEKTVNLWTVAIGTGAGGGKLISSVGAGVIGTHLASPQGAHLSVGVPLLVTGGLCAGIVALMFFGPDCHKLYPNNAWPLKCVSIGSALLMIGGNMLSAWGGAKKLGGAQYTGAAIYMVGNGMMSISFRNFIAISEVMRGRATIHARTAMSLGMAATSASLLAVLNLLHPDAHDPRGLRAGVLAGAASFLALSLSSKHLERVSGHALSHSHVVRQALGAVGIAAFMGISLTNPVFEPKAPLKSLALSLVSGFLFGAVAVDESEILRALLRQKEEELLGLSR